MIILNDIWRRIEISDSGSELGPIRVTISFHFDLSFSVCSQDKNSKVGDFYQFGHSFLFHTWSSVFCLQKWTHKLDWKHSLDYKIKSINSDIFQNRLVDPSVRPPDGQCLYLTLFWGLTHSFTPVTSWEQNKLVNWYCNV